MEARTDQEHSMKVEMDVNRCFASLLLPIRFGRTPTFSEQSNLKPDLWLGSLSASENSMFAKSALSLTVDAIQRRSLFFSNVSD